MYQNKVFDVIIVGASYEGIALCEYLKEKLPALKVALVSSNFTNCKPRQTLDGIEKVEKKVIYSSYNHNLIGLTLEDRSNIFGLNVVIATGSRPIPLDIKSNSIYYKTAGVKRAIKANQAVVVGNDIKAINAACWAAKKFKYVYFCSPNFQLNASKKDIQKLNEIENIVHLPNSHIIDYKNDKRGNICEVSLDTYDTIRCNSIIAITDRLPDIPQLHPQMIELDDDGYIVVNHLGETTRIPKLFAVGACTKYNSKRNIAVLGRRMISINNWKQEEK